MASGLRAAAALLHRRPPLLYLLYLPYLLPSSAMPSTRRRPAPEASPRLTREDWLAAAHAAVVRGGFDQVKVLTLASELGVTRGSFYWHFESQSELIDALVQQWQQRQADALQALRATPGGDPVADLHRLLDAALAHAGDGVQHMRFGLAVRGLARRRPEVARAVAQVDAARLALFGELFARLGGSRAQAEDRATLFYLAVAGAHQALSRPGAPADTKARLRGVMARQLIGAAPPAPQMPKVGTTGLRARVRRGSS